MSCHKCRVDFCDSEGIWLTAVLFSRDPVCIFSHCAWSYSATQHQRGFLCHVLQLQLGAHPLPFQLCQKSLLNWKSRLLELSFLFSNLPLLLWIFMSLLKAPFSSWAVSGRFILSANPYARFSHCLRRDLWQEGTTTTALLSLRWGAQALKFAAAVTESQNHLCWKGAWAISTSPSCAGPWSWVLKTSKDGSFTTSLGNLSLFFATPMGNFFLICSQNLPSVVSDYCTTSSHSVLPDRAWFCFLSSVASIEGFFWFSLKLSPLQAEQAQCLSASLRRTNAAVSWVSGWPPLDLPKFIIISLAWGCAKLDEVFQMLF